MDSPPSALVLPSLPLPSTLRVRVALRGAGWAGDLSARRMRHSAYGLGSGRLLGGHLREQILGTRRLTSDREPGAPGPAAHVLAVVRRCLAQRARDWLRQARRRCDLEAEDRVLLPPLFFLL